MVSNYLKIHPLLFSIPIMLIIVAFAMMLYYTYTRSLRLHKHLKTHFLSSLEEERKSLTLKSPATIFSQDRAECYYHKSPMSQEKGSEQKKINQII